MRVVRVLVIALIAGSALAACSSAPQATPPPTATAQGVPSPAIPPTLPGIAPPTPNPIGSTPAALPLETVTDAPAPTTTLATITVEEGDTLLGIALRYGVPMAALQLQNQKGTETMVRLGERLEIPSPAEWEGASPYWILYSVAGGDTLSTIASAYSVTVADIEAASGISAANPIHEGQLLILPLQTLALALPFRPTAPLTPSASEAATSVPTATPGPLPTPAHPVAAAPPADIANWPYETIRIMNAVRATYGLPPLVTNETLAQAAQIQANDCAQRGWCSHTGSDGSDIKDRILRVGYDPATWAECWAQRQTPQAAIDIWMDEVPPNDPHRRTLLTTWLTEVGVGVAKTSWGYYFIADFGRPR